jgi:hypothetical protein
MEGEESWTKTGGPESWKRRSEGVYVPPSRGPGEEVERRGRRPPKSPKDLAEYMEGLNKPSKQFSELQEEVKQLEETFSGWAKRAAYRKLGRLLRHAPEKLKRVGAAGLKFTAEETKAFTSILAEEDYKQLASRKDLGPLRAKLQWGEVDIRGLIGKPTAFALALEGGRKISERVKGRGLLPAIAEAWVRSSERRAVLEGYLPKGYKPEDFEATESENKEAKGIFDKREEESDERGRKLIVAKRRALLGGE